MVGATIFMGEMMGYGQEYGALLKEIAEQADAIAMRYFRGDELRVERKRDGTAVTRWCSLPAPARPRMPQIRKRSAGCRTPREAAGRLEDSGSTCWSRKERLRRRWTGPQSPGIWLRSELSSKKREAGRRTRAAREPFIRGNC